MYRSLSLAIIVAAGAVAQSLSSKCQQALTTIVADSEAAACLNPSALIGLIGSENTSIIGPVNNWLTGICSSAPCSNQTLANIVGNVTAGCDTELGTFGFIASDTTSLTAAIQLYYPTARKVLCLKNETANEFCVTGLLNDVQDVFGTLSINGIVSLITSTGDGKEIPSTVTCSDCVKEAYNIIKQDFPESAGLMNTSTCGASFNDGQSPANIKQTATTAGASNNNNNSATRAVATSSAFLAVLGSLAYFL